MTPMRTTRSLARDRGEPRGVVAIAAPAPGMLDAWAFRGGACSTPVNWLPWSEWISTLAFGFLRHVVTSGATSTFWKADKWIPANRLTSIGFPSGTWTHVKQPRISGTVPRCANTRFSVNQLFMPSKSIAAGLRQFEPTAGPSKTQASFRPKCA